LSILAGRQDRKRVAERLYQDGMTQAAIGAVMGVDQATVSRDIANLCSVHNSKPRPKTETNPRGAGRPRKQTRAPLIEQPRPVAT
jgi:hypothetical protein